MYVRKNKNPSPWLPGVRAHFEGAGGLVLESARFFRKRGDAARSRAEALKSEAFKMREDATKRKCLAGARQKASAKGQGLENA